MNAVQARRLLQLADYLEKEVGAKRGKGGKAKFDMRAWFEKLEGCTATRPGLDEASCGTSACAFGWAAALWPRSLETIHDDDTGVGNVKHRQTGATGADAAAVFFGLNEQEVDHLFMPSTNGGFNITPRTAKAEAKVIRNFVRRKLAKSKRVA